MFVVLLIVLGVQVSSSCRGLNMFVAPLMGQGYNRGGQVDITDDVITAAAAAVVAGCVGRSPSWLLLLLLLLRLFCAVRFDSIIWRVHEV